jgi:protocatechuate 4,5-dioxygenase alpha chain
MAHHGEKNMSVYDVSRLLYSLRAPHNREAYRTDPEGYYEQYHLTPDERALLRTSDWPGLVRAGVSIYLLTKLMATVHADLLDIGASMRGVSKEEFLRLLKEQAERNWQYALLVE